MMMKHFNCLFIILLFVIEIVYASDCDNSIVIGGKDGENEYYGSGWMIEGQDNVDKANRLVQEWQDAVNKRDQKQ